MSFFEKRQIMEKRTQEEKTKTQVVTSLDHARNLVRKQINEGTNEKTNGISAEDLITYKKIKGKSTQQAHQETADLFTQIKTSKNSSHYT